MDRPRWTRLLLDGLLAGLLAWGLVTVTTAPTAFLDAQGVAFTPNPMAPTVDAAYDLGLASRRFKNLYLSGGVIGSGSATMNSITSAAGAHLTLNTTSDNTQVRINSRSFAQTSGDSIGFQSKPSQTVTSSGNVIGGQVSPRLQTGVALTGSGSLIGFHVDTDMKGTTGNVGGDVRGMEIELVSDGTRTSTVTGNLEGIHFRTNAAMTVGGNVYAFRIPTGETAAGQWTALARIDNVAAVFDDTEAGAAGNKAGFLKVIVNGNSRFLRLYDAGN